MSALPLGGPPRSVQEVWEDFSLSFTPAVREVVEFARHIPGFQDLTQQDQVTVLKAGTFEVSSDVTVFVTPMTTISLFSRSGCLLYFVLILASYVPITGPHGTIRLLV